MLKMIKFGSIIAPNSGEGGVQYAGFLQYVSETGAANQKYRCRILGDGTINWGNLVANLSSKEKTNVSHM